MFPALFIYFYLLFLQIFPISSLVSLRNLTYASVAGDLVGGIGGQILFDEEAAHVGLQELPAGRDPALQLHHGQAVGLQQHKCLGFNSI